MARHILGFLGTAAATAGLLAAPPTEHRRSWEINRVTWVKLVPKEKDAPPNAHPARLDPSVLRQGLAGIQMAAESGDEPLFAPDELAALAGPLSEALDVADPGEDIVLLSSHRRGLGLMSPQLGLTARLFVHGGLLNFIVRETRLDFVGRFVMNNDRPEFRYGSRQAKSLARLRGVGVQPDRSDWVVIPVTTAIPSPVPKPVPTAAPAKDAGSLAEQRLRALKRLRDENLVTEAEFQKKRQEILKDL